MLVAPVVETAAVRPLDIVGDKEVRLDADADDVVFLRAEQHLQSHSLVKGLIEPVVATEIYTGGGVQHQPREGEVEGSEGGGQETLALTLTREIGQHLAVVKQVEAAAVAELGVGLPQIAYLEGGGKTVWRPVGFRQAVLRPRLLGGRGHKEVKTVDGGELGDGVDGVDGLQLFEHAAAHPRLQCHPVDAVVGQRQHPVGGVREVARQHEVGMFRHASGDAHCDVEVHAHVPAHKYVFGILIEVVFLGPEVDPGAELVEEGEVGPPHEVAVEEAEEGDLLADAFAVEMAIAQHCPITRVVKPLLPLLPPIGLPPHAHLCPNQVSLPQPRGLLEVGKDTAVTDTRLHVPERLLLSVQLAHSRQQEQNYRHKTSFPYHGIGYSCSR